MKIFKAPIISNEQIGIDFFELVLSLDIQAKPGQFMELRLTDNLDPLLNRPFSIATSKNKTVSIWYLLRGSGTNWLSKKKKGDIITGYGPLGNTFPKLKGKSIFVVGGCGTGPIRFLSNEYMPEKLLIGGRSKINIFGLRSFKKSKVPLLISTDDGSLGHKGFVTELLVKELQNNQINNIVAVGPTGMLKTVAKIADENNIDCWLSLESYMACGIGSCYGCSVKTISGYKRVCKDGPVFNASDIIWE